MPAPVPCIKTNYHAFPTTYPSSFIHSAYPLYYPSFSLRERERERNRQTHTERKRDRRREERDLIFNSKLTTKVKSGHKKEGGGRGGQKERQNQRETECERETVGGYKISSEHMYTLKIVSSQPDIDEKHTLIFFLYPPQYLIFMNCMH